MSETPSKSGRTATPADERMEEATKLRNIWQTTAHENQTIFGEKYEIGTQSAVGQFLRGESPLSLKAARGFATGLKCSIADFSPRLAKEAQMAAAVASNPSGPGAELLRRIEAAAPETARLIELALLSETDLEKTKLSPSLKGLIGFVKQQIKEESERGSQPT